MLYTVCSGYVMIILMYTRRPSTIYICLRDMFFKIKFIAITDQLVSTEVHPPSQLVEQVLEQQMWVHRPHQVLKHDWAPETTRCDWMWTGKNCKFSFLKPWSQDIRISWSRNGPKLPTQHQTNKQRNLSRACNPLISMKALRSFGL